MTSWINASPQRLNCPLFPDSVYFTGVLTRALETSVAQSEGSPSLACIPDQCMVQRFPSRPNMPSIPSGSMNGYQTGPVTLTCSMVGHRKRAKCGRIQISSTESRRRTQPTTRLVNAVLSPLTSSTTHPTICLSHFGFTTYCTICFFQMQ